MGFSNWATQLSGLDSSLLWCSVVCCRIFSTSCSKDLHDANICHGRSRELSLTKESSEVPFLLSPITSAETESSPSLTRNSHRLQTKPDHPGSHGECSPPGGRWRLELFYPANLTIVAKPTHLLEIFRFWECPESESLKQSLDNKPSQ